MYTFDVFDTLITRTTATPKGIFSIMHSKLQHSEKYQGISGYIKDNFYSLRIYAEGLARNRASIRQMDEILLEEIYEALNSTGCLTSEEAVQLMELERITEYEHSVGITHNIARVKELINRGEQVLLLSDMYLDRETIRDMLIKADPIFMNIPLYVSSEFMQGKWSSRLYRLVKEKEQAHFENWIHFGDNSLSDVEAAARLGIQTELIPYEALTPYELKVLEKWESDSFIQLTIGAARNTRLEHKLSGTAAIGASIGGPILVPYVWWVLQESLRQGIHRLYFIARDGYVLKEIADRLINEYSYNIETFYIYGSRRAWRMPSFSERNGNLYKFASWSYALNIKNISGLADIFQIPLDDFLDFLPQTLKNGKRAVTPVLTAELIKVLNANEDFKRYLRNFHKDKRTNVIRYLQQEVNVTDDAFAFVDLSGGGFTQGCLAEIMSDFYDKKPRMFYLRMDRLNLMDNCISLSFLPSFFSLGIIIEMLCRAPHGQTVGYCEEKGRMVPEIKADGEGESLIRHGFYEYINGIKAFTARYASVIKQHSLHADSLNLLLPYMDYITKTPDDEILTYFGSMPNGVTGREQGTVEFAPVLNGKTIRQLFLYRTTEAIERYYPGSSLEYSLLRATRKDLKMIEIYRKIRSSLLGKLVHLPKTISKGINKYPYSSGYPCEVLDKRIVLYGAGKMGQELYRKITYLGQSQIVQWIDKNFVACREAGLPVLGPQEIGRLEFDSIVIGVQYQSLADKIRAELIAGGIPDEKIKWINLQPPKWE